MTDRLTGRFWLLVKKKASPSNKKMIIKSRPKMPLNGLAALKEVA